MATFYFNGAVDNDWATLGNWWMDSACTIQATSLPTSIDNVVVNSNIETNSGSDPTVANLTVDAYLFAIGITVTGIANFNSSFFSGTITGDCVFSNNSITSGVITGDCTLSGGSYNDTGTITGDCTFSSSGSNGGYITGNCIFDEDSWNYLSITGDCTFNDISWNAGTITGNCTFNDSSYNSQGSITGNATFNGSSYSNGTVTGDATFNGDAYNAGYVMGAATFNNNSYSTGPLGSGVFNNYSYSAFDILNNATFNDFSNNRSAVFGAATFNGDAYNASVGSANTATFNNSSRNDGAVTGDATFNDDSFNTGIVSGAATYNGFTGTNTYGSFIKGELATIIYIRTNGDNDTGDGSEALPYLTAQKAFDVAVVGSGPHLLNFGIGNFGGVTLTQDWPSRIAVVGVNATQSFLGGINGNGTDAVTDFDTYTIVLPATNGKNISIVGNNSINLGTITTNGAYGGDTNYDFINGSNGGNVYLTNIYASNITATGGTGGNLNGGNGGNGGNITLNGCSVNELTANGGLVSYVGNGGRGGDVELTDSSCGNININGSDGDASGVGGSGGNVLLTNSIAGNINSIFGINYFPGVVNGNITLSSSTVKIINAGTVVDNGNNTGYWNSTFYILSVATTLNSSGTGAWNSNYYRSGTLAFAVPSTIYVRTTGSNSTGDGSENNPLATAQIAFDAAINSTGNRILNFGAGNFGGVVLTQDWPSRIAVRGAGNTQSFLGGIDAKGQDFEYFEDGSGGYFVINAGDGHNVEIYGNNDINIGNVITTGGNGDGNYYCEYCSNGINLSYYGWVASVGDGGNVVLHDVKAGNIDTRTGNPQNYWDYTSDSGNITLSGVLAGNLNATNQSYTFATVGVPGGSVSLNNSTVGNIYSDGAPDGLVSGPGGTITLLNSTCLNISSNGGGSEGGAASGGSVTLTNSNAGDVSCKGSWNAFTNQDDIVGLGGSVDVENSTVGNINLTGDGPTGMGNALFESSSNQNTKTVTGNATFGIDSYNAGVVTNNATFNNNSYNSGTVEGYSTFNSESYNIGTVSGGVLYNGFTGPKNTGVGSYYFILGEQTELNSCGSGVLSGVPYIEGVIKSFSYETPDGAWSSCANAYLLPDIWAGSVRTTNLNQSGTGLDSWSTGISTYFINGSITNLDQNGNGCWQAQNYTNGSVTSPADGWDNCTNHYWLGGQQTSLDSSGSGFWNNNAYYYGNLQADGWNGYYYYINDVQTSLDQNGSGCWNNIIYYNGSLGPSFTFTGFESCDSKYYINGIQTTLDESGTGLWDGTYYINGQPFVPRTLYFNTESINSLNDWANLSNWWDDDQFTIPATSLPTIYDDVIALVSITINSSGSEPTVANFTLNSYTSSFSMLGIPITVTGVATFNQTAALIDNGIVNGNAIFNNNSTNYTTVNGNATFNGDTINYGLVNGNAVFNNYSFNIKNDDFTQVEDNGTVINSATFNGNSTNLGSVGDNATFNGASTNYGTVTGTATFAGSRINYGTVGSAVYTPNSPEIIYVSASGSDNNIGTESSPLASAQRAFEMAYYWSESENRTIIFGAGSFGGVDLSSAGRVNWTSSRISVQGAGATQSYLGGISGIGQDLIFDYNSWQVASYATPGLDVTINNDKSINLGDISLRGGNADQGQSDERGENGGSIILNNAVVQNINNDGGSSWGEGKPAGDVTLSNTNCGNIESNGSTSSLGLGGGNAGEIILLNSTSGNITANGGSNGGDSGVYAVGPGLAGNVTLTNSTSGNITCVGGGCADNYMGPVFGSVGGTVSLLSSYCGTINVSGGTISNPYNYIFDYDSIPGDGGNVTLEDSISGNITANGGVANGLASGENGTVNFIGYSVIPNEIYGALVLSNNLKKGRGINGSSILGIV